MSDAKGGRIAVRFTAEAENEATIAEITLDRCTCQFDPAGCPEHGEDAPY